MLTFFSTDLRDWLIFQSISIDLTFCDKDYTLLASAVEYMVCSVTSCTLHPICCYWMHNLTPAGGNET